MAKRRMHKPHVTRPKPAYSRTAKKPEADDKPAPMGGGRQPGHLARKHVKRLKGVVI